jgi:hypothetical protein
MPVLNVGANQNSKSKGQAAAPRAGIMHHAQCIMHHGMSGPKKRDLGASPRALSPYGPLQTCPLAVSLQSGPLSLHLALYHLHKSMHACFAELMGSWGKLERNLVRGMTDMVGVLGADTSPVKNALREHSRQAPPLALKPCGRSVHACLLLRGCGL